MPLTSITIIIAPYHVGLYDHRVGGGPLRIMSHGIDKELSKLAPVSFINIAPVDEFEGEIGRTFEILRRISNAVSKAVSNNSFPLVLSGNCYASTATMAGLNQARPASSTAKTGVLWLDAHDDLDTPSTHENGYLDAMAASMMTGTSWHTLMKTVPGHQPVDVKRMIYCGLRDVSEIQHKTVKDAGVDIVWGDAKNKVDFTSALAETLDRREDIQEAHIHFDLDVLDDSLGRANEFPSPGGFLSEDVMGLMGMIPTKINPTSLVGVRTLNQQKRRPEPQQPGRKSWYSIDKYALFSLAASCKTLHTVAEDILYHEFAPGYSDSELSELYTYDLRLNQFMRTVGTRKDLAEKVRMVFIHPKHSNADVEQTVLSLKQGAADLGIDIAKAWRQRAEDYLNYSKSLGAPRSPKERKYVYMLNSAFTDEIFQYLSRRYNNLSDDFYKALHHELIPMLIALLPKLDHIIYKHSSTFKTLKQTAFEALKVTELPYLRRLEIDYDVFSILERAPHLAQIDFLNSPFFTFSERVGDSFDGQTNIKALRLGDMAASPALSRPLPYAAKDLRSLVIEASTRRLNRIHRFTWPNFSIDTIEKDSTPVNRFKQGLLGLAAAATSDFPNLEFVGLDNAEGVDATVEGAIRMAGIEFAYESWPVSYSIEPDEPDDV
ncbi:arginase [Fusarium denticulatum]|uniref:Arginase n=1 Tax=Fusarium denticulatum TaxID=48507 RepID=A0A8H5T0T4_9HYPO|nr:arginase [Fusarium denticulatum]